MEIIYNDKKYLTIFDFSNEYEDEFKFNPSEIFDKIYEWAKEQEYFNFRITWDIPPHLAPLGYYTVGIFYETKIDMMKDSLKRLRELEYLKPEAFKIREWKKMSKRIESYKKYKEAINEGN